MAKPPQLTSLPSQFLAMATVVVAAAEKEREREREMELTVQKISLFSPGDGFEAYDHHTGEIIFRVDTYDRGHARAATEQIVLMDTAGTPILTVRRKWASFRPSWEGFKGVRQENQKPLFTVRHSSIFGGDRGTVAVEVHEGAAEYRVEGSFWQCCCRVLYDGEQERVVAAEIKRKMDTSAHGMGRDVFCLCVKPGFDAALLMGVVLILNQICGNDDDADNNTDEGRRYASKEGIEFNVLHNLI